MEKFFIEKIAEFNETEDLVKYLQKIWRWQNLDNRDETILAIEKIDSKYFIVKSESKAPYKHPKGFYLYYFDIESGVEEKKFFCLSYGEPFTFAYSEIELRKFNSNSILFTFIYRIRGQRKKYCEQWGGLTAPF